MSERKLQKYTGSEVQKITARTMHRPKKLHMQGSFQDEDQTGKTQKSGVQTDCQAQEQNGMPTKEDQADNSTDLGKQPQGSTHLRKQVEDSTDLEKQAEDSTELRKQAEDSTDLTKQADESTDLEKQAKDSTDLKKQAENSTDLQKQAEDSTDLEKQAEDSTELREQAQNSTDSKEQEQKVIKVRKKSNMCPKCKRVFVTANFLRRHLRHNTCKRKITHVQCMVECSRHGLVSKSMHCSTQMKQKWHTSARFVANRD